MPRLRRGNNNGVLDPDPVLTTINGVPRTIFVLPQNPFDPSHTSEPSTPSSTSTSQSITSSPTTSSASTVATSGGPNRHIAPIVGSTIAAAVGIIACLLLLWIIRHRRRRTTPVAPFTSAEHGPSLSPGEVVDTKRNVVSLMPSEDLSRVLHVKLPPTPSDNESDHRTPRSALQESWSSDRLEAAVRQRLEELNARVIQLEARERETLIIADNVPPPEYREGLET